MINLCAAAFFERKPFKLIKWLWYRIYIYERMLQKIFRKKYKRSSLTIAIASIMKYKVYQSPRQQPFCSRSPMQACFRFLNTAIQTMKNSRTSETVCQHLIAILRLVFLFCNTTKTFHQSYALHSRDEIANPSNDFIIFWYPYCITYFTCCIVIPSE